MSLSLFKTLRRQRMMPLLILLQVALACAVLANVLFLFQRQLAPVLMDDGIAGDEVLLVDQLISREGGWKRSQIQAGAEMIRALPGVRAVSPTLGLPMRQTMNLAFDVGSPAAGSVSVSGFAGEGLVKSLGLQLSQGRDFESSDYQPIDLLASTSSPFSEGSPVIITRALANHLFPDGHALGKSLSDGKEAKDRYRVVGIVDHLLRYQLSELDDGKAEYSMLLPARVDGTPILSYAVRVEPEQRQALVKQIREALNREFGNLQMAGIEIQVVEYDHLRDVSFKPRRAAAWLLGTVSLLITLITLLGIASLTAYWVAQRTRQIGIRRALGATRGQILRHFLAENLTVVVIGMVLGMPLALLGNQFLMSNYELPRLPLQWLPIGGLALILIGQLAVFGPARRAAAVPPAVATRSA